MPANQSSKTRLWVLAGRASQTSKREDGSGERQVCFQEKQRDVKKLLALVTNWGLLYSLFLASVLS